MVLYLGVFAFSRSERAPVLTVERKLSHDSFHRKPIIHLLSFLEYSRTHLFVLFFSGENNE